MNPKKAKRMAELVLLDPKHCVLCIIPGCYMADLCSLPNGKKYRVIEQNILKRDGGGE